MTLRPDRSFALPRLGGKSAVIIFVLTLVAFVLESQLAQVRTYFHSRSLVSYLHKLSTSKLPFSIDNPSSSCESSSLSPPLPPVSRRVSRSYIVHSAFAFTFPLHLLSLLLTAHTSVRSVLEGLSLAIKIHFAPSEQSHHAIFQSPFPRFRFLLLIALLTVGVTIPALLWFISVSLSP